MPPEVALTRKEVDGVGTWTWAILLATSNGMVEASWTAVMRARLAIVRRLQCKCNKRCATLPHPMLPQRGENDMAETMTEGNMEASNVE